MERTIPRISRYRPSTNPPHENSNSNNSRGLNIVHNPIQDTLQRLLTRNNHNEENSENENPNFSKINRPQNSRLGKNLVPIVSRVTTNSVRPKLEDLHVQKSKGLEEFQQDALMHRNYVMQYKYKINDIDLAQASDLYSHIYNKKDYEEYRKKQDDYVSPAITKIKAEGNWHKDTEAFDDLGAVKEFAKDLLDCRLIKIRLWYGNYDPTSVVNGIQLTYKNMNTGKIFDTPARYGFHQLRGFRDYDIDEDEYIVAVGIKTDMIIRKICFLTSKDRQIESGGTRGLPFDYEFGQDQVVVGMHGGFGGHLHNIGFYTAPLTEVRYFKRRIYLLMMEACCRKDRERPRVAKIIERGRKGGLKICELAVGRLLLESRQTFRLVMEFL